MIAEIIFDVYVLFLLGYTYITYSKRCIDFRYKIWCLMNGVKYEQEAR